MVNYIKNKKNKMLKYDHEFNPMQKKTLDAGLLTTSDNFIISSPTASGKTVVAELVIDETLSEGRKAIYMAPMKSLVEEKAIDFAKVFPKHRIIQLTSDYDNLSAQRQYELASADIIILTNEMLQSRSTKHASEKNNWLTEVGCLVVDEIHILCTEGRGATTEVAVMTFSHINPSARLLFLSATINNLNHMADWMTTLTSTPTTVIESDYRPTKLTISHVPYDSNEAPWKQLPKIHQSVDIIAKNPDDKYIVFCPSRAESEYTANYLKKLGYKAEYHNAELSLDKRRSIESRFKTGDLQIIASTPTLSTGINLPSKHVIVQGTYRGIKPIDAIEIIQCCGRAGRPKYDKEGFAHIIHPYDHNDFLDVSLHSVLENQRELTFHLLSQIYLGIIKTKSDAESWWHRTFAYHLKTNYPSYLIEDTISQLTSWGMLVNTDSRLVITELGTISIQFYIHPADTASWVKKFTFVINKDKLSNDFWLSYAITPQTEIDATPYVTAKEREEVDAFHNRLAVNHLYVTPAVAKHVMKYFNTLTTNLMKGYIYSIRRDINRKLQAIKLIDLKVTKWDLLESFDKLALRFKYAVPEDALPLITIDGIGHQRAIKLINNNIKTPDDILRREDEVVELLGDATTDKIVDCIMENNLSTLQSSPTPSTPSAPTLSNY